MACGEAAGQAAKDLPTVRLQGQMACGFPAHPISFVSLEHSASHSPGLPTCFQISDIEGQMLSFLLCGQVMIIMGLMEPSVKTKGQPFSFRETFCAPAMCGQFTAQIGTSSLAPSSQE